MASVSPVMLAISTFGLIVVAATILGDYGLTPLGKGLLRVLGVLLLGIGLLLL